MQRALEGGLVNNATPEYWPASLAIVLGARGAPVMTCLYELSALKLASGMERETAVR